MSVIDKAKMAMQVFKMKKEIESQSYEFEDAGIKIVVTGFMAMSEPKLKNLVINGVENKAIVEAINKALKKSTEASMRKMQELGKGLEGMV
jgi:DNA-binding protein YbaB